MQVSYQHANPRDGQDSYYIKFSDEVNERKMCVLVDSGRNVSVKEDLGEDEFLAGILLTHPHGDHYATLPSNIVDGASVYTSPATARVLEQILNETGKHGDIGDSGKVSGSLTPITDWETLFDGVDVCPVSAGHCPGAVGYIIRFTDNGRTHRILATGDFTFTAVAGNRPMLKSFPFEIDAMFLNSSITGVEEPSFTEVLNNSVETVLESVIAGGETLLTTSGLAGVHYAYILGHLFDQIGHSYDIVVAGHIANLYEDLGYNIPNVTVVNEFSDPKEVINKGDICIAGPSVPVNNTSKVLFEEIVETPGATLIQVLSGNRHEPIQSAKCTVYEFSYLAHPKQSEIDEFVETAAPRELIIEHGRTNMYGDRYNHTITWSNRDYDEYVLYSDGFWRSPHWINPEAEDSIRTNHQRKVKERFNGGNEFDIPSVTDRYNGDLAAEGIQEELFTPNQKEEDKPTNESDNQGSIPVDGGPADEEISNITVEAVMNRLERIEEKIDGAEIPASVIDSLDGDVLLRVNKELLPEGIEHGDSITIQIPPSQKEEEQDEKGNKSNNQ